MKTICGIVFSAMLMFGQHFPVAPPNDATQVEPDAAAIVAQMAENLELASHTRKQYVYDKSVSTSFTTWGWGSKMSARYEKRRYVVSGVNGPLMEANGFLGECRRGPIRQDCISQYAPQGPPSDCQVEPYTDPGFQCKGLARIDTVVAGIINSFLDEDKSLDSVPYWLLPLRPAYLKFFTFTFNREGLHDGRRVYIIDFKPARGVSIRLSPGDPRRDARAWEGTLWVDADEAHWPI